MPWRLRKVNNIKTLIGVLVVIPFLCACSPQGPTAKEIFELRSQCGKIRNEKIEATVATRQFNSIQAHYDPTSNRCYLYTSNTTTGDKFLSDGQLGTIFASVYNGSIVIHNKPATLQEFLDFVKEKMGEDLLLLTPSTPQGT